MFSGGKLVGLANNLAVLPGPVNRDLAAAMGSVALKVKYSAEVPWKDLELQDQML